MYAQNIREYYGLLMRAQVDVKKVRLLNYNITIIIFNKNNIQKYKMVYLIFFKSGFKRPFESYLHFELSIIIGVFHFEKRTQ